MSFLFLAPVQVLADPTGRLLVSHQLRSPALALVPRPRAGKQPQRLIDLDSESDSDIEIIATTTSGHIRKRESREPSLELDRVAPPESMVGPPSPSADASPEKRAVSPAPWLHDRDALELTLTPVLVSLDPFPETLAHPTVSSNLWWLRPSSVTLDDRLALSIIVR